MFLMVKREKACNTVDEEKRKFCKIASRKWPPQQHYLDILAAKQTTDLMQANHALWMGLRSCHCEPVG
jgi:hypothetical protein